MDPLSITASLIAVLQVTSAVISICYDYRQGVKHASREVIQLSDELGSLKDVLDALLRLVEKSGSESVESAGPATFQLLVKPEGPLLTCQSELERLKKKLEPETGWRAVKKSLVWPLQEGELRKAVDGLERLKSTMQLALSTDQTTLSLTIRDGVEDLTRLFQRHNQKYKDIFRWLAAPDPHANHVVSRKKRQPKSGEWFLSSKQYECWLHGAKSFLWIYGIPGSGKTILCSTIIDRVFSHCQEMPKRVVAYFYFDFNDTGKQNISSLVRSLITQLAAQSDPIPLPLLELYDNYENGIRSVDDEDLMIVFRNIILTLHDVYIILDALDESSDCEQVLQFIASAQEWNLSRLHVLATSRQLAVIEEAFDELVSDRICLHSAQMNEDIAVYIDDRLANDKSLTRWPPEIRGQIRQVLIAKEDGMFQWVVCQLDILKRCMSIASIKKGLNTLPKNLDETYDRILLEIDEFHQVEVLKTLQAIIATVEPLHLDEMVEILAVDLDTIPQLFDADSRLIDPRSILSICCSLVIISPQRRSIDLTDYIHNVQLDTLRLAHASVADYLTQPKPSSLSKFHFSRHSARQFFARTCLVYLMNSNFVNGYERSKIKQRLKDFPFLKHATRFWPMYLEKLEGDPEDHIEASTKEILRTFFSTSKLPKGGNFAFWVGMLIPSSPYTHIQGTHPLYYAASFGLTEVVRILLETEKDIDIDQLGGRARSSALHVAVFRDHIEVAKLLLERGADPDLVNGRFESPLHWASEEARDLLISYGAKDNRSKKKPEIL